MIFEELGAMRWPMSFSFIAVVALSLWSAQKLVKPRAVPDLRTKALLDGVLFWGGFAAISGFLGTLIAIIVTLQRIEAAGQITPTLVAGGWKVGLLSTSLGLFILGVAALVWFGLQLRWRFLHADAVTPRAG